MDRLLASPHYGERWGRHWLDLARYAESEGFKADETRAERMALSRLRDPVASMRTSRTTGSSRSRSRATSCGPTVPRRASRPAFNRHYPDESNARVLQQRRQEILDDITDTTGAVFLGLTYGCARCHNHKFDPILQADYYRLQAFFANTAADDHIPMLPADAAGRIPAEAGGLGREDEPTSAPRSRR